MTRMNKIYMIILSLGSFAAFQYQVSHSNNNHGDGYYGHSVKLHRIAPSCSRCIELSAIKRRLTRIYSREKAVRNIR